ncbi:MAG: ACP S-malonyltransferase [Burkholderiaceae bacterium]
MRIAFLFPGQGSQSVGMLEGFNGNPNVERLMQQASAAINQDLAALIANGPAEELNLTVNTQPIMLASSLAFIRAYQKARGPTTSDFAGHSLGEYTALVAAGALDDTEAVRLVQFRAQAMQQAVPPGVGAMAAILGLDGTKVDTVCKLLSKPGAVVEAVNFNSDDQTVIAGHAQAVSLACDELKQSGAKRALALPVSAPFHSSLLEPAARELRERLAGVSFAAPSCPVWHNLTAQPMRASESLAELLSRQAMSPVRWVQTIRSLVDQGVTHFVECGPGKVLTGLTKKIAPSAQALNITDETSLQSTLESLRVV